MALAINHGLGGPKVMAKAAADGMLVNIPALRCDYPPRAKEIDAYVLLVWYRWSEVQARTGGRLRIYLIDTQEEPSEKSSVVMSWRIRTVNRHWWIGREAQGERVICL